MGKTKDLLRRHLRDPFNGVSIQGDECLVRGYTLTQWYDLVNITVRCADYRQSHSFSGFQKGFLTAALIGTFRKKDKEVNEAVADLESSPQDVFDVLLCGLDASHLSDNSRCSDPFHLYREAAHININRDNCLLRKPEKGGTKTSDQDDADCSHWPRCMPERKWQDTDEWREVREKSSAGFIALPKPFWQYVGSDHHNKRGTGGQWWTSRAVE